MAWHRFKVKGKHYMTKRMRTLDIIARSDVAAKQKAITQKLLPPFICEEIDFKPPSKKLLEQATSAGINIPVKASSDDVISLLERKDDIAPPAGLIAFAERWDIYFSQYIGNKALFNITFKNLPPESKSAFFVFSVYRFLSGDKKTNLDTHPYKDIFYKFAAIAANDARLFRSINNYKGEHLCTFGSTEGLPAGYKAGGTRTIAYKAATAFIEDYFDANYQPRALKDDGLSAPAKPAPVQITSPAAAPTATAKNKDAANPTAKNTKPTPAVFIISKNDRFVPSKAIELKNKIVKIPDLENKATADLPVYSPKNELPNIIVEHDRKKLADKSGCLGIFAVLILLILIMMSLLF